MIRSVGVTIVYTVVLGVVSLCVTSRSDAQLPDLISSRSVWKYKDDGSDQGTAWNTVDFDDALWSQGPAKLGYGEGDEGTVVVSGAGEGEKFVTTYFRHTFTLDDPNPYKRYEHLGLQLLCDDGCIVYLNGSEIWRVNMPDGQVGHKTWAAKSGSNSRFLPARLSAGRLQKGRNVVAVEVHQRRPESSDIGFDLQLTGAPAVATKLDK